MVVEDYPLEEKKEETTNTESDEIRINSNFQDIGYTINGNMGNFTYTVNYDMGLEDLI